MSAQPMSERKVLFHMGKIAVHKSGGGDSTSTR